jgi:hypothetical protein
MYKNSYLMNVIQIEPPAATPYSVLSVEIVGRTTPQAIADQLDAIAAQLRRGVNGGSGARAGGRMRWNLVTE